MGRQNGAFPASPRAPTLSPVSTAPVKEPEVISLEASELALPWITLVWNDPVNLMSYVVYVFETYFGYPRAKAESLRDLRGRTEWGFAIAAGVLGALVNLAVALAVGLSAWWVAAALRRSRASG